MKAHETEIGNCIIAKFLGSEYINSPYKANKDSEELTDYWNWTKPQVGYPRCMVTGTEWSTAWAIGNFKFHKSWDWMMLVVERINSTHNKNTANGSTIIGRDLQYTLNVLLGSGYIFTDYMRYSLPMTLENVWLRSIEYIEYLNSKS